VDQLLNHEPRRQRVGNATLANVCVCHMPVSLARGLAESSTDPPAHRLCHRPTGLGGWVGRPVGECRLHPLTVNYWPSGHGQSQQINAPGRLLHLVIQRVLLA